MPGSNFANNYDFFGNLEKNYKTDNESNITKLYKKSKLVVHFEFHFVNRDFKS